MATSSPKLSGLADFLFGTYRREALALLLMHHDDSYHVPEIARLPGRPAKTLYRELGALAGVEESLRREVNPHLYGVRKFSAKLAAREPFLTRVVKGPKIFLIGDADDLGKLAEHRAAQAAKSRV
jgi:hypothetical protein